MKKIIIAGSGPIGSFMALLCGLTGFDVVVYEKRNEFTRNINLKIEKDFFKYVHEIISRLNIRSDFFEKLNDFMHEHNDRILIRHMETKFVAKAKAIGVRYVTKDVNSFQELLQENGDPDAIVLDCTGRNSPLRKSEFGADEENIVITPLQHAMYINFKAKTNDKSLSLYQAMKYITNVKLTEVVFGKKVDVNGFIDVTIPVFITEELAKSFDLEFPDINRHPLNPFNSSKLTSDEIFHPISALLGNLIVDGCNIDLNSVLVKKIEISCGYAKNRSRDNFVCLGDAAVFLAFFRSLNLGLKHALDFFIKLSMFRGKEFTQYNVIQQFKLHNPLQNPIKVIPTKANNVFMIVTNRLRFSCFSFNLTTQTTEELTDFFGVTEDQVQDVLYNLNKNLTTWRISIEKFEAQREEDIKREIKRNKDKSLIFDYAAWFVDLNSKSVIKISELARLVEGKPALLRNDFSFMLTCFKSRNKAISNTNCHDKLTATLKIIQILVQFEGFKNLTTLFNEIYKVFLESQTSNDEKLQAIKRKISFSPTMNIILHNFAEKFILSIIKNEIEGI